MHKLGLVGKNISHSKSKEMYQDLLGEEVDYSLFDYSSAKDIPCLEELFKKVNGLSITAPYKKHFTDSVEILGSVSDLKIINCIRKIDNKYEATNTDYLAVDDFLKNSKSLKDRQVVLLGSGSMAEITKFSANLNGIELIQLSRSKNKEFNELCFVNLEKSIGKQLFIINACAREYNYNGEIPEGLIFWDYNYRHDFHINRFTQSNTQYIDGIDLLKHQAAFALDFWKINH